MAGLYIHIPFCESRVHLLRLLQYHLPQLRDDYVDALAQGDEDAPGKTATGTMTIIKTIYLGGGTPSQLTHGPNSTRLSLVSEEHSDTPAEKMEITMECNPDDVYRPFLQDC